jgi:hypothetical protein
MPANRKFVDEHWKFKFTVWQFVTYCWAFTGMKMPGRSS